MDYKRLKTLPVTHKLFPHCSREVNIKTYKAHKRLYYDPITGEWQVQDEKDTYESSSEESDSSLEDYIASVKAKGSEERSEYCSSQFEEPLNVTSVPASQYALDSTHDQSVYVDDYTALKPTGKQQVPQHLLLLCVNAVSYYYQWPTYSKTYNTNT